MKTWLAFDGLCVAPQVVFLLLLNMRMRFCLKEEPVHEPPLAEPAPKALQNLLEVHGRLDV